MGIFPIYFTRHKLTVDETYLISDGKRIREAKLVHSTARGFNFLDVVTQKKLFKKHLYPREIVRDGMKDFTFMVIKGIIINKKQTV